MLSPIKKQPSGESGTNLDINIESLPSLSMSTVDKTFTPISLGSAGLSNSSSSSPNLGTNSNNSQRLTSVAGSTIYNQNQDISTKPTAFLNKSPQNTPAPNLQNLYSSSGTRGTLTPIGFNSAQSSFSAPGAVTGAGIGSSTPEKGTLTPIRALNNTPRSSPSSSPAITTMATTMAMLPNLPNLQSPVLQNPSQQSSQIQTEDLQLRRTKASPMQASLAQASPVSTSPAQLGSPQASLAQASSVSPVLTSPKRMGMLEIPTQTQSPVQSQVQASTQMPQLASTNSLSTLPLDKLSKTPRISSINTLQALQGVDEKNLLQRLENPKFSGSQTPATSMPILNLKTPQNLSPIRGPISFSTFENKATEECADCNNCNNVAAEEVQQFVQAAVEDTISSAVTGIVESQVNKEHEFLELLKERGYKVSNILIGNDGKYKNIIATNIRGDPILIEMDHQIDKTTSYGKRDLLIEKSNVTVVPQRIKVGTLACLDANVCKAAFVCNDSICLVKKQEFGNGKKIINEETAIMQLSSQETGGRKEGSVAFPTVSASTILNTNNEEIDISSRVSKDATKLVNYAIGDLYNLEKEYKEQLDKFRNKIGSTHILLEKILNTYNEEIEKLEFSYDKILSNDTDSESKKSYYEALAKKKSIRIRLINALYNMLNTMSIIKEIGADIDNNINPILNEFMTDLSKSE